MLHVTCYMLHDIPSNFGKKTKCLCGEVENLMHIYKCKKWNETDNKRKSFRNIHSGNIQQQIEVFRKFEENFEKRNEKTKIVNTHVILDESTVDSNL